MDYLCRTVRRLSTRSRTAFDVFLSYSWGDKGEGFPGHARVVSIAESLNERFNLKCWLESFEAWDGLNEKLPDGIDDSQAVCVCLTQHYVDKVSRENAQDNYCGREYFYTGSRERSADMEPVVLESPFCDQREWIRMMKLVGDEDVVDLVDSDAQISRLANIILEKLFPWDDPNDCQDLLRMYPASANQNT